MERSRIEGHRCIAPAVVRSRLQQCYKRVYCSVKDGLVLPARP
jgi:hypothetical protein